MSIWLASASTLLVCVAFLRLDDRFVRPLFGVLAAGTIALIIAHHLASPGHEFAQLLLLGIALAGLLPGRGLRGALVPLASVMPLAFLSTGAVSLAVHNHWHTVGAVVLGAAVSAAARATVAFAQTHESRGSRLSTVVALSMAPVAVVLFSTVGRGPAAWNTTMPMVSGIDGQAATVIALQDSGASAWGWFEALRFGFPLALLALALVFGFVVVQKEVRPRGVWIAAAISAVVVGLWTLPLLLTPGGWSPLSDIDPAQVLAHAVPAWVPAGATRYLMPEVSHWVMSPAAVAVWLGGGISTAVALLVTQVRSSATDAQVEMAAAAPLLFALAGLLLQESATLEASALMLRGGALSFLFALAALSAGASSLKGALRPWAFLLSAGGAMFVLAALLAEKVFG